MRLAVSQNMPNTFAAGYDQYSVPQNKRIHSGQKTEKQKHGEKFKLKHGIEHTDCLLTGVKRVKVVTPPRHMSGLPIRIGSKDFPP